MKNKIYYSKQYDMHIREVKQNSTHSCICSGCVFFVNTVCCDLKTNDRLYEVCIHDGHGTKFIRVKL